MTARRTPVDVAAELRNAYWRRGMLAPPARGLSHATALANAFAIAVLGDPLFSGRMRATVKGPYLPDVVASVPSDRRSAPSKVILGALRCRLSEDERRLLDEMVEAMGSMTLLEWRREFTDPASPWRAGRSGPVWFVPEVMLQERYAPGPALLFARRGGS